MMSALQTDLKKSFNTNSNQNALWLKGVYYSYEQLAQKINAIIPLLPKDNKCVAIITYDEPETYATIIASFIAGVGFVPISPSFPLERVKSIVEQADIDCIFSVKESDVDLYRETGEKIVVTANLHPGSEIISIETVADENKIACILFTSGSTGIPKGVPMTYRNINTTLDSYYSLGYGPFKGYRCLQMFEFTFDMSLLSYLPAFLSGACVYSIVDDKRRFLTAFKVMKDFDLTFAVFVPSTLAFMHKYFPSLNFPALKCCMVGGEPFPVELAKDWAKCAPATRIINISGPTETTMACMGYELNRDFAKNKNVNGVLAFGKPWKNTTAIVVDEQLKVLPVGGKGELCFAGENVMNGYVKNAERNTEVFFNKTINDTNYIFYRTGDGAFMDEDGDFYTTGRIDMQVKIQGYRVEPGEIEAVVRQIANGAIIAAVPYKKHDGFNAIRLFIENSEESKAEILAYMNSKLPPYMIPDEITSVKSIPLNMNGKIDKNYLKRALESGKF